MAVDVPPASRRAQAIEERGAVAGLEAHTSPAFHRCMNERAAGCGGVRPWAQARSPGAIALTPRSGRPRAAAWIDAR